MRASPVPRSIYVLISPQAVVTDVLASNSGFGALFGLLAVEYLLIFPLEAAAHAMRASFNPAVALLGLWSSYVHFALTPALVVFGIGTVLYYALRFWGRRIAIWAAASVVTYTWVPHLLMVAAGMLTAALWAELPWLPHLVMTQAQHGTPTQLVGWLLAFGPSVVLLALLVRAAWRQQNDDKEPSFARLSGTTTAASSLLIMGLLYAGLQVGHHWQKVRPVMPNDLLPPVHLVSLDGAALANDVLVNRVALIDFWATWCGPCVAAMPGLEALHRELGNQGFMLVSVSTEPDNLEQVRAFVREHQMTFPVYLDAGGLQRQFNVQTFPTAVLVDRHGRVRNVFIGALNQDKLRREVVALLGE